MQLIYQHSDSIVLQLFGRIRRLTDAHYVKHLVLLELLQNISPHSHIYSLPPEQRGIAKGHCFQ